MKYTGRFIKNLQDWISQPDIKDPDKNLSAFYIQTISLTVIVAGFIIGVVYAIVGQFGYVVFIAAAILVHSLVIGLIRFKKLQFASNLFNISTLGLLTLGILSVGGIHALGSILYPLILIFASLLLGRRSFFIYTLLCILSVGLIVYAENQKISPPYIPDPPVFYVFFTFSLMLVTSALFIRFVTESLQNNLRKVRLTMQEVITQKAMLDHVGQAVVGCDMENRIIYWNQAATGLYGWESTEVIGRKYYDVIPTQLTPEIIETIRVTVLNGEVWSGEFTINKRDQSEIPVIGTVAPLRDEHDKVSGWIGIAADLTARKISEQESKRRGDEIALLYRLGVSLASGENLYSTLLALQTEIVQLIQADAFYVAIYNEETDMISFPVFFEEGKTLHESDRLLHEWPGLTGAVISSGKTLYLPDMSTEEVEKIYHPYDINGIELYTFLGIPLISNEHVLGMLSMQSKLVDAYSGEQIRLMENVAVHAALAVNKAQLLDRLQLELVERKRAEEKYRTIFEQSIDGIFQSTPDGRFLSVNLALARMYGYDSPEEMVQGVTDIASQIYIQPEVRNDFLRRLAAGEKITGFESQEYRRDGSTLWTSMNAQAIHDGNGNFLYYEGTVEDITLRKELERKRTEAETLYRSLVEQTSIVVYRISPDESASSIYISPQIQTLLGYSAEEWLQDPLFWKKIVHPQDLPNVLADVEHYMSKKDKSSIEYRIRNKAGDWRWLRDETVVVKNEAGIVQYVHGVFLDITELKEADEILRESEERYRTLVNGILDGIYRSSHDGRFLDVNPAMIRMFGYDSKEEMLAVDIKKEMYFAPEERESLFLDTGQEKVDEFRMRRKDGSEIWVEDHGHYVHDKNGNVIYHEGIVRDITERKRAETEREKLIRELAAQNAESETLRESLASIVGTFEFIEITQYILDQIKRVIPYDSASVWKVEGKLQKFISGRNLPAAVLDGEIEFVTDETNSAMPILTGEIPYFLNNNVQEELEDFKQPPHTYINSWLAIPLKSRGKIVGVIALDGKQKDQFNEHHVQLAVTFANQVAIALENSILFSELQSELMIREKLIRELELKNTELERFTYTVSHDLKSPLVTINGFLGYLKEDSLSGNSERLKTDIQRIQDAVDKMHLLLRELLELSRIGRIMNPPEKVSFEALVHDALEIVHGRLEAGNITVHIQPDLPAVQGDRQRLMEVLQNLVDNAAKYMGSQSSPRIDIGQDGEEDGKIRFYVKDNGIGISPQYHNRIFGLFDKLDQKTEGTGVGLAIVKRIVEVHGGRIWVESEAGKGSTFYFTLGKPEAE
jgi:PAS domain S-box-containing protein